MTSDRKCPHCSKGAMRDAKGEAGFSVGDHAFKGTVSGQKCNGCGVFDYPIEEAARFEAAIARRLARGPANGAAFRFLRKEMDLTAVKLGELLGVHGETVSRWENGRQAIDVQLWALMGWLTTDREAAEAALRRAKEPEELGAVERVEVV